MKKTVSMILSALIILSLFGCGSGGSKSEEWYQTGEKYVVDGKTVYEKTWELDSENRKSVEYLNGAWNASWTYDSDGNETQHVYRREGTAYNTTVDSVYDNGLLVKETTTEENIGNAAVTEISYEYDSEKQLVKKTELRSNGRTVVTEYVYGDGKLLREIRNGVATEYQYFDDGTYEVKKPYADDHSIFLIIRYDEKDRPLYSNDGYEYTYVFDEDGNVTERDMYINGNLAEEYRYTFAEDGTLSSYTKKNVNGTWEMIYEYENGKRIHSVYQGIDGDAASTSYQQVKEYFYTYTNGKGKTVGGW